MEQEEKYELSIDDKINMVLDVWFQEGIDIIDDSGGVPVHPELIYRLSGEWRGWNHFLEVLPKNNPLEYELNKEKDHLEELAFLKYKARN